MLFGFVQEAEKVTPELLQVEPNAKILYAQDAIGVYERRQQGVVDVAVRRLLRDDPVFPSNLMDDRRITGKKRPALQIGAEILAHIASALRACRAPGRR